MGEADPALPVMDTLPHPACMAWPLVPRPSLVLLPGDRGSTAAPIRYHVSGLDAWADVASAPLAAVVVALAKALPRIVPGATLVTAAPLVVLALPKLKSKEEAPLCDSGTDALAAAAKARSMIRARRVTEWLAEWLTSELLGRLVVCSVCGGHSSSSQLAADGNAWHATCLHCGSRSSITLPVTD
ncbi:uncharacterized protein AMSG_03834 [Thecamonas trahens ATCC 50062]|uniref:Uncharacterized protein n=1 Tax=Thecamonas trahens ATCC 50062 TaxID=461836 RepID=A0A0L0D5B9_THETB|nr:hypothetical protein AMSG_03834 [Thecamonas trahens ATCC 50062]KNC47400.1 hypothetical protein AMSG_03834 [Thecamonas trahens ATCC 50062]|eukprot:XP_013759738.1 hypothetical protein AMSG_03834 [Thecamonas trahens ATCC 50062]